MAADYNKKSVYAWAMYDWANSAFATTVVAGFFPVAFKQFWSAGSDVAMSTLRLGTANALASVIVALSAPVLGAIADKGSAKKKLLLFFSFMGIVMTGSLHLVAAGQWELAVLTFVLASVGFSAANIFYDSLLVSVAGAEKAHSVSALGFALGYLGGGILFALNVVMTIKPEFFGLRDTTHALRFSFITVAIWWAVFSVPIFLFVKEPPGEKLSGWVRVPAGFAQVKKTLGHIRNYRTLFIFLLGYWLYIDGVYTIVRMAVDYGLSLGLRAQSLVTAILITQFVGFPAAIVFGKLGERWGAKTGIYIGLGVYAAVCIGAYFINTELDFYVLATTIGLVQGGVASLSRSLYSRLVPHERSAEFFGFYNMLGKFAAVLGPLLIGWTSVITGNPRLSTIPILILFLAGGMALHFVKEERGRATVSR